LYHIFYFILQGLTLKGWIEMMSGRDAKKAIKYFDDAITR